MSGFLTHYRIQLVRVTREPFTLLVLIFTAAASLFFWPGLCDPDDADGFLGHAIEGVDATGILFIWLIVLSMLSGILLAGPIVAGRKAEPFSIRAFPALPVGPGARNLAEAAVIVTFIVTARGAVLLLGERVPAAIPFPGLGAEGEDFRLAYAGETVWGCFLIFPFILSWVAPARATAYYVTRPILLGVLCWIALELGFLSSPGPLAGTSLVLSLITLLTAGKEPLFSGSRMNSSAVPVIRRRPCLSPERQLRRDLWLGPLPAAALLIALEIVCLILNQVVALPRFGFYMLSSLVFGFILSFVILRPMGSSVIAMGLSSLSSYHKPGDFCLVWANLPVRREAVTRGIYLHGLVTGTGAWLFVLGVNLANTWLKTGELYFADTEGDPAGKFFFPMIALIPCLAGGLTCAAKGDTFRGIVSLAAVIAVFIVHFGCLMARAPMELETGILIAVAAAGGIPPLVHLRTPRPSEQTRSN